MAATPPDEADPASLRAVEERLDVGTREVVTGRVRLVKRVREREETVDPPLQREVVAIRRIVLNREVDGPVPVRQEGDVMIVPVLEEVAVVTKRLVLKEELHVTLRRYNEHRPQQVALREETIDVERVPEQDRAPD